MKYLFKLYETLDQFNATTPDDLLVYSNVVWPGVTPLILLSLFLIILYLSYLLPKLRTNDANLMASYVVASFITFLVATIMTLKDGIINSFTYVAVSINFIISLTLLYFARDRNF